MGLYTSFVHQKKEVFEKSFQVIAIVLHELKQRIVICLAEKFPSSGHACCLGLRRRAGERGSKEDTSSNRTVDVVEITSPQLRPANSLKSVSALLFSSRTRKIDLLNDDTSKRVADEDDRTPGTFLEM
jgi:hypothetical protein